MKKELSRRSFLKGAAVSALGLGMTSMMGVAAAQEEKSNIDWVDAADLVVVGGGGAGFCAAIEAARAGSSVLILEKNDFCGGDTVLSGGMVMAGGTSIQKKMGVEDSAENFAKTELGYGADFVDKDMVREMCLASPDAIEFMISCGREYDTVMPMKPIWGYDKEDEWAPRTHYTPSKITGHFTVLYNTALTYDNIRIKTLITAEHLITDDQGTVIGVKDTEGRCYRANKAVLLSTASFGTNKEMSKRYNYINYWALMNEETYPKSYATHQCQSNTGDGIRMAQEIGADLALTSASCIADCSALGFGPMYGAFVVNEKAQRFMQESAHWGYQNQMVFNEAVKLNATNPEKIHFWIIADQNAIDNNFYLNSAANGVKYTAGDAYFGMVVKVKTIEELAEKTGLEYNELKKTIDHWNEMVAAGEDTDFGRRDIAGNCELAPFGEGPYYALPYINYSMGAFGGLRTNHETQVVKPSGEPINRLYAAGSIMSGMFTAPFYNACGWSLLGTVHWGRKAGVNIAALEPWTTEAVEVQEEVTVNVADAIANAKGSYKAGTYTAVGNGRNGGIPVTVTFSETAMTAVEIGENTETPGIGTAAIEGLPTRVLGAQSADVDVFSGATLTSDAILEAVRDCIAQASK